MISAISISFLCFYTYPIIIVFTTVAFLILCAQKIKPSSSSNSNAKNTTTATAAAGGSPQTQTNLATATSMETKTSTKKTDTDSSAAPQQATSPPKKKESSTKSAKNVMMDSIRIIRGKKNIKQAKTMAARNPDSDSQHTELINVPIGKASENPPSTNKLTVTKEQKTNECPTPKQKVTFSTKINRSNMKSPKSPSQTETAPS